MKYKIVLFLFFCVPYFSKAQKINTNPFRMVDVPDSISILLDQAYSTNAVNVNAGKNVFNLQNRHNYVFGDGIYSFQGQGPHFPRRLFIFNKGMIYIFHSMAYDNIKGVLTEFSYCIDKLHLSDTQGVNFNYVIASYMKNERGFKYRAEIKAK